MAASTRAIEPASSLKEISRDSRAWVGLRRRVGVLPPAEAASPSRPAFILVGRRSASDFIVARRSKSTPLANFAYRDKVREPCRKRGLEVLFGRDGRACFAVLNAMNADRLVAVRDEGHAMGRTIPFPAP